MKRLRPPHSYVILGVVIVAVVTPAFLAFNYLYRFGVNAVYWDEWKMVELFDKRHVGILTWGDLLGPHSEHQIVFPRMIMFGLARLTHLNTLAPMYVSYLFLLSVAAIVLAEHLHTFGRSTVSLALFIPSAWLIFTLRQSDNLLWGWQLQIMLHVLSLVGALYCLTRVAQSRWAFVLAIFCGIVSSLSFSAGMAVWPAGLVCMELSGASKVDPSSSTRYLRRVSWVVTAAVLSVIYVHGYVKPAAHPSTTYALENPGQGLLYLLTSLGGALTNNPDSAAGFGLLLLLVFAALIALIVTRSVDFGREAFGAALLVYWLAVGVLLTIGRGGFGAAGGTSSRYATMTVFGAVGCWRSVLALQGDRVRRVLLGFVLAIMCMGVFGSLNGALTEGFRQRNRRRTGAEALRHYRNSNDADLVFLHPSAAYIRLYAPVLEQLRLNVFWDDKATATRP